MTSGFNWWTIHDENENLNETIDTNVTCACIMSHDTLLKSAGRPAYASEWSYSKQRREKNNKHFTKREEEDVGGEEAEMCVGKCMSVVCRMQENAARDERKRSENYISYSQDFLNFSCCWSHETRVSVSFLSFFFLSVFFSLLLLLFLMSEPNRLSTHRSQHQPRTKWSTEESCCSSQRNSVFVRHFKTTVEFARSAQKQIAFVAFFIIFRSLFFLLGFRFCASAWTVIHGCNWQVRDVRASHKISELKIKFSLSQRV